jgi:hypothetical protein
MYFYDSEELHLIVLAASRGQLPFVFCQEKTEIFSALYLDFSKEIIKDTVSFLMSPRAAQRCVASYWFSENRQGEVGVSTTTE